MANNFVSERNSVEVMTVGLNAIREICLRAPLAMDEDLLHDLVMYRGYRDKNVSTAARSIVALYRQVSEGGSKFFSSTFLQISQLQS